MRVLYNKICVRYEPMGVGSVVILYWDTNTPRHSALPSMCQLDQELMQRHCKQFVCCAAVGVCFW